MTTVTDLDRHDPDLCADLTCPDPAHMPDRDTTWGEAELVEEWT